MPLIKPQKNTRLRRDEIQKRQRRFWQLVKKVLTDIFDCASAAEHFDYIKMLLRSKSLKIQAF